MFRAKGLSPPSGLRVRRTGEAQALSPKASSVLNFGLGIPSFAVTLDENFMMRALELARLGAGQVSPNPLVGCVIVHDGQVIGEGWHRRYGESHAEVNAINSVVDQQLLQASTVYVNLEPCNHRGKTPPCSDLLIEKKVSRVVVGNFDTNPVAGGGIKKLREAGVEVVTDVLGEEGRELNKRFFIYLKENRPYIILKWAETADGFIARTTGESKWISNVQSRQLVHRWRAEEDAVLVGTRTAMIDNPQLNVRDWSGRNPLRVMIDRNLKLDSKLNLFDGSQPTICYNLILKEEKGNLEFVKLEGKNLVNELVEDLNRRKVQSLMVEGGAETLSAFVGAGLWDEARVFRSTKSFETGIAAPKIKGELVSEEQLLDDTLSTYVRIKT